MVRRESIVVLGIVTLSAGSACSGVEGLGSGGIAFGWQVSPRGCVDSGVRTVEAHFAGPEGIIERFDCESGAAEVGGLEVGPYTVRLTGIDRGGKPIFESAERRITVDADRVVDLGTIRLTASPADVQLNWMFANGRVCGANEVDSITIAAYDDSDYEVVRESFGCDEGGGTVEGLPAGAYLFEVTGYSAGIATHRGTTNVKTSRGDVEVSDVVLERIR